jgi:hypothetical protein
MSSSDEGFFNKAKTLTPLQSGPQLVTGFTPSSGAGVTPVSQMSNTEKLRRTIEYALSSPNLSAEIKRALGELLDPESLAIAAGVMVIWAVSHFFGVGEVVDVILAGTALVTLGVQGMQGLADLIEFGNDVINAETDFDLRRASDKLVRAFVLLGVEAVIALLTRKAHIKPTASKDTPVSRSQVPKSDAPPRTPEPPEVKKPVPPVTPGKPWADYDYSDLGKVAPCFPPGTLVRTRDGCRPIEELVAGDEVLAFDEETGTVTPHAITGVSKNTTQHIVTIRVDDETIRTTRLHDFWVEDKGDWLPAWRLWAGMLLRSPDGRPVAVQAVEIAESQSDSYNLEVEYAHTFFVGRQGVLVHNGKGKPSTFENVDTKPTAIYGIYDKDQKKFIYVGQTTQLDALGNVSPQTRFEQHLGAKSKAHWNEMTLEDGTKVKRNLKVVELMNDKMTPYDAAVWELHQIKKYQNEGHPLENVDSKPPIGEKKFKLFQGKHSPCS